MTSPIRITIAHRVGRAEARRRLQRGFDGIVNRLPGTGAACRQQWNDDRLSFSAGLMGQSIAGTVDVHDDAVTMEIEVPGLLGMFASGLKSRLEKAGRLLLTKK